MLQILVRGPGRLAPLTDSFYKHAVIAALGMKGKYSTNCRVSMGHEQVTGTLQSTSSLNIRAASNTRRQQITNPGWFHDQIGLRGSSPHNRLQTFTISMDSDPLGATSVRVNVRVPTGQGQYQEFGTLGIWMGVPPLINGQTAPSLGPCTGVTR